MNNNLREMSKRDEIRAFRYYVITPVCLLKKKGEKADERGYRRVYLNHT